MGRTALNGLLPKFISCKICLFFGRYSLHSPILHGLLLKQILRRNTFLLPASLCALYPATLCFLSIFELATGLQTAKIGLTVAWPQAHFSSSAWCPNRARSRDSQKVLPVFCLKNTQWFFGQQPVKGLLPKPIHSCIW